MDHALLLTLKVALGWFSLSALAGVGWIVLAEASRKTAALPANGRVESAVQLPIEFTERAERRSI